MPPAHDGTPRVCVHDRCVCTWRASSGGTTVPCSPCPKAEHCAVWGGGARGPVWELTKQVQLGSHPFCASSSGTGTEQWALTSWSAPCVLQACSFETSLPSVVMPRPRVPWFPRRAGPAGALDVSFGAWWRLEALAAPGSHAVPVAGQGVAWGSNWRR